LKEKHIVAGLLFICCAGLVALLAFKGFNKPVKTLNDSQAEERFDADFNQIITTAKNQLGGFEKSFVNEHIGLFKNNDTAQAFAAGRMLTRFWDSLQRYDISGYYYYEMAQRNGTEFNFMNAAQRFLDHGRNLESPKEHKFYVAKAKEGFQKALEINPGNLDAKTGYAICVVDNPQNTMTGVIMLRDTVLKADSTHLWANYELGLLQIKSNQLPKALATFKKLISLQPLNGNWYLHLADIEHKMGNKEMAILYYEKAKGLTPDDETRKSIEGVIKSLKNEH